MACNWFGNILCGSVIAATATGLINLPCAAAVRSISSQESSPPVQTAQKAGAKDATLMLAAQESNKEEGVHGATFSGNVSWYGGIFNGRKTASGEIFDLQKLTAAHRHLPFFTKVLVENPKTGRSCVVKVNDRGPFVKTRVLDLSQASMRKVAPLMPGLIWADCLVLNED